MRNQVIDYSVDLTQALIWKYDKATNLLNLILQKQTWYDVNQQKFWENWYTNVFDLQTANLFGLAVWSYILDVPLYVPITPEPTNAFIFGFNQIVGSWPTLLNTYRNFGEGNFSSENQIITLNEEEQRFILRLRYFQLYTRANIQGNNPNPYTPISGINDFLNYLLSTSDIGYSGTIYALDGLNMTMTYVFTSPNINPSIVEVIKDLDLFPRPDGVGINYVVDTGTQWGFGPYNQNFGHGNFIQQVS